MLRLDHIRSGEDSPANDVPELPHVPRPGIVFEDPSRRFRDPTAGAAELHAGLGEEPVREVEDVVSLPEGRHGDREFAQAVVGILAEPARRHLSLDGDVGGGDDPYVHRDRPLAADWLNLSFL